MSVHAGKGRQAAEISFPLCVELFSIGRRTRRTVLNPLLSPATLTSHSHPIGITSFPTAANYALGSLVNVSTAPGLGGDSESASPGSESRAGLGRAVGARGQRGAPGSPPRLHNRPCNPVLQPWATPTTRRAGHPAPRRKPPAGDLTTAPRLGGPYRRSLGRRRAAVQCRLSSRGTGSARPIAPLARPCAERSVSRSARGNRSRDAAWRRKRPMPAAPWHQYAAADGSPSTLGQFNPLPSSSAGKAKLASQWPAPRAAAKNRPSPMTLKRSRSASAMPAAPWA